MFHDFADVPAWVNALAAFHKKARALVRGHVKKADNQRSAVAEKRIGKGLGNRKLDTALVLFNPAAAAVPQRLFKPVQTNSLGT